MKITPDEEAAFIEKIEGLDGDKDSAKESLQGFVTKHYPMLKAARDRGNSYEEIARIFDKTLSVSIRPETLRKYMSQAKKKHSTKGSSEKVIQTSTRQSKPSLKTQTKSLSSERRASILSSRSSKDISNEFPTL